MYYLFVCVKLLSGKGVGVLKHKDVWLLLIGKVLAVTAQ